MEIDAKLSFSDIGRYNPVPWDQIPDLGLYMDQVITFICRVYEPIFGDSTRSFLSAPMINNYVKNKLIPRPKGKKYSRLQIAMLIMIVTLKRVCTMEDIRAMLICSEEDDIHRLYDAFCSLQTQAIDFMLHLSGNLPPAMTCAIYSSAFRAGCEWLLRNPDDHKE